MIWCLTADQ